MINPFYILNVNPESSQDEIKQSYRNFVKIYHPDIYPGNKDAATEKMQELNWAFEILSDPIKRREYEEEYYEKQKCEQQRYDPEAKNSEGTDSQTDDCKINNETKNQSRRKTIIAIVLILITVFLLCFVHKSCNSENEIDDLNSNYSEESSDSSTEVDTTVYVTHSGTKYHRSSCSYLSDSKREISLNKAISKGYTPCSRCDPPRESGR